ncbi:hypothetical protein PQ455_20640 (plasmid) [Sphingomonas naphthae]|uniref:Tetratricopeptide repeat protein n=1 Tax=Sphingomonas naphthae TaxID=1813468 RepID=A0ABY7TRP6_9SPHN|nr:hypothetical protein [Sphingomonas naphthae]WCT75887.1 hypothetical protein PQ455_20640 [Sphingomonas naphthae]
MNAQRPPARPRKSRSRKGLTSSRIDLAALAAALDAVTLDPDPAALDRAQDAAYDAWEASGADQASLARSALAISPLCADAYVLLAEDDAVTDLDATVLYRLGMKAGELALGEDFENLKGEFWGWLQTRPYMRARAGRAGALYRTGHVDEALGHWRALLDLNPGDNQGVRYTLALVLLDRGDDGELRRLLGAHDDDAGIATTYTRALIAFRDGDLEAGDLLTDAIRGNRHVAAILAGTQPSRVSNNGYLTMGGTDEATIALPAEVPFAKRTAGPGCWVYDFHHVRLGPLGRLVLTELPDNAR